MLDIIILIRIMILILVICTVCVLNLSQFLRDFKTVAIILFFNFVCELMDIDWFVRMQHVFRGQYMLD